ncbi:DMT family transporter [Pararobbsia silviterrae]|uniref:DMT family transporter n=1 Tax=Pararobbsia silviterrae TaxID=1792498 RepID=A0A494XSJ0_9BURK|nr:DMT family transporter [Pararobbsia silviterrae]RKP53577.1 DMT family transporter [Pararobbsia silviterrae]
MAARSSSGVRPFVLGCALLGTIGIFVREAHADPLTAAWFRCAFGLAGLTLWFVVRRQAYGLRLTRTSGPWVLVAGALMVLSWCLFFNAIERISTGVAIVLFQFQPMWMVVLGVLCLKESVGRRRVGAVSAAMIGLVFATGLVEHAADSGVRQGDGLGVVLCLVGALCTACAAIIARRLRDLPMGVLAWWQCAIGTLTLWVWPMRHGWPALGASWLWLAGLGIVHTALAYTLMYSGMARLNTGRIALLQFVYPAVAIVIDRLVFGQHLSGLQLAGIAVISIAVGYAERAPRR